jgi:hypothetical protein
VLDRFFGLGNKMTVSALREFIAALSTDELVKSACGKWLFANAAPEQFSKLLYDIGFIGVEFKAGVLFRTPGWRSEAIPPLNEATVLTIHPMYVDALQLQDRTVASLDGTSLRATGLAIDHGLNTGQYQAVLQAQIDNLKTCPTGKDAAVQFETIVGNVIRYCFLGHLENSESQVNDCDNTKRRDWIVANRATTGFWQMVKIKYHAVQIVWECKNFSDLSAEDFRQIGSYLNTTIGLFGIVCYRGEFKKHYWQHLQKLVSMDGKVVFLLNDSDLLTFLRQAQKGKHIENYIQTKYDELIRRVS